MNISMIERVARAMWDANLKSGSSEFCSPWESETEALRADWRSFARAAIEAMREPTGAMVDAGYAASAEAEDIGTTWPAMIDEALS